MSKKIQNSFAKKIHTFFETNSAPKHKIDMSLKTFAGTWFVIMFVMCSRQLPQSRSMS